MRTPSRHPRRVLVVAGGLATALAAAVLLRPDPDPASPATPPAPAALWATLETGDHRLELDYRRQAQPPGRFVLVATTRLDVDRTGDFALSRRTDRRDAASDPATVRTHEDVRRVGTTYYVRRAPTGPYAAVAAADFGVRVDLPALVEPAASALFADTATLVAAGAGRYRLEPPRSGPESVVFGDVTVTVDDTGRPRTLDATGRLGGADGMPAQTVTVALRVTYRSVRVDRPPTGTPDPPPEPPRLPDDPAHTVVMRIRELQDRYGLAARSLDALEEALARLPADHTVSGVVDADGDRRDDDGTFTVSGPNRAWCVRLSEPTVIPGRDVGPGPCPAP